MESFVIPMQVRWSDLDPNFHLRHSVYYDWGALCRVEFLAKTGLTWQRMQQLQIGPILFREECIFKREIRLGDPVTVGMELLKARKDFSRFTIRHEIKKDPTTVSAILTVDIAWINGVTRKLAVLPEEDIKLFGEGPFATDFQWTD
ncbi:MAG TPA: acyl-CoA thioesterase [Chitinophagaceae bacterium]|jgi:acyl-CoA thioester hydrolase|nr:acyl-CoA thioesterase [Chitinophagaceae bacterium]